MVAFRNAKFVLGRVVATPGVLAAVLNADLVKALGRHQSGDWGNVCEEDWASNDKTLREEGRLDSSYLSETGVKFYIITEWDRSVTTFLLPSEY